MNTDLMWAFLLSWGAGINLYLTALLAGMVGRLQWMPLPKELDFLSSDVTLIISAVLFLIEFVADKIPYVDSFWDAIHTFIRVPAGVLLALGAASGMSRQSLFLIGLAAGLVSFGTHGAKASIRLALNSTPEPFTNWFVSIAEDGLLVFFYWLFLNHPLILFAILLITVFAAWLVIYLLIRIFKRLFRFQRPKELKELNWSVNPKKY